MAYYLTPIKISALLFPVLAIFLTIPYAIFQYRKHGYINKIRTFIIFSFLFYIITAYYLVILPVPKDRDVKSTQSADIEYYNLRPFRFIEDIKNETKVDFKDFKTYPKLLGERAFLQVIFNVFLTLPLGVYMGYYFKLNFLETLIVSLSFSFFFEFTQLSGLYGIYNAPYRIFDVDDLFLNTLGGGIGYLLSPIITGFLPESDSLDDEVSLESMRVGYFRRGLTFFLDMLILSFIPGVKNSIIISSVVYIIYFIGIVYLTKGRSLASYLTAIQLESKAGSLSFKQVFTRNFFLLSTLAISKFLSEIVQVNYNTRLYKMSGTFAIIHLIYIAFLTLHLLVSIFKKDRLFYEKLSKTRVGVAHKKKG